MGIDFNITHSDLDLSVEDTDFFKNHVLKCVANAQQAIKGADFSKLKIRLKIYLYHGTPDMWTCGDVLEYTKDNPLLNLWLRFPPDNLRNPETLENMQSTVFHECSHADRIDGGPGFGMTIADTLIFEGLAEALQIEKEGVFQPYAVAIDETELSKLVNRLKTEGLLNKVRSQEDYQDLFFGNPEKDFPKWGGYTLGYAIVGGYLEKYGLKASEINCIPTDEIIRPWLNGDFELLLPTPTREDIKRDPQLSAFGK